MIKKVSLSELYSAAVESRLQIKHCAGCHYQLIGGSRLVNFYYSAKGSKIYVDGESKGRLVNSVEQVIEATGAKMNARDNSAQMIFRDLCAEVSDGHVTVSLSRDIVSLSCADREHAMRVFSLIERISELQSKSFSDWLDKRYS